MVERMTSSLLYYYVDVLCSYMPLLIFILFFGGGARQLQAQNSPVERVAFTACLNQDLPQGTAWASIERFNPDLVVLLGDNVYAATDDMAVLAGQYAKLAAQPGFRALRARSHVLATWDDNDYGMRDGGRGYSRKEKSRLIFLKFFDIPLPRAVWARPGIYDSYWLGPGEKSVHLILLDTRTFRSELVKGEKPMEGRGPYVPNDDPRATVLGEAQWEWLKQELTRPSSVAVVASSIQVLSDRHGYEGWGNFPGERARLLGLLRQSGAKQTLVVSGDRHHGEVSELNEPNLPSIAELTVGSLNMARAPGEEFNPYRWGKRILDSQFGALTITWGPQRDRLEVGIIDSTGEPRLTRSVR